MDQREQNYYWMLYEDLLKYIFADKPYTAAELSMELQKLEDKYNILLTE